VHLTRIRRGTALTVRIRAAAGMSTRSSPARPVSRRRVRSWSTEASLSIGRESVGVSCDPDAPEPLPETSPLSDQPTHELNTDRSGDAQREGKRLSIAITCVGCLLAAGSVWISRDFIVDDALISLRYVRNLLAGNGLVFNLGEYIEGYTNLGHVLLVSALGAIGVDLIMAARFVGLTGGALAVIYGPAVVLPDRSGQRLERAVARLLLLANFFFVYFCWSGLETGLYVGLIAVACYRLKRRGDVFTWDVGLLAGLLFVVRPDGLLFTGVLISISLFANGLRKLLSMAGPWISLAIVAAVEVWRYAYYGALVPNTAHIKGLAATREMAILPWYGSFGDDLIEMLSQTGGVVALFFVFSAVVRHRDDDRIQLAFWICVTSLLFLVYSGGDWMLGYRYLAPLLPFYFSLLAIGLVDTFEALRQKKDHLLLSVVFYATLVIVAVGSWSTGLDFRFHSDTYPNTHMTSRYMIPVAKWLAERYPASYQITAGSIGALGYYTDLNIIDTVGLTDATIAGDRGNQGIAHVYIRERNPELLLMNATFKAQRVQTYFGRSYRIQRYFYRGIERPWILYVREDIPLLALNDDGAPSDPSEPMRLLPTEQVPQNPFEETSPGPRDGS
jgi:arabinofuranosyltransferase